MLCKKIVNFFSLLSHTHEPGSRKTGITQELLSLVTGLAHYLKILIRIALTAALKLEREYNNPNAIGQFLNRLDKLARDPDASKPTATSTTSHTSNGTTNVTSVSASIPSVAPRTYGYRSLTRAVGGTLIGQGEATTDLCEHCHNTVEEECVRYGTSLRWHLNCMRCYNCNRPASKDLSPSPLPPSTNGNALPPSPTNLRTFKFERSEDFDRAPLPEGMNGRPNQEHRIFCSECPAPRTAKEGFELVTRLEQYAFLLCVALNKLYALLKHRGIVPAVNGKSFWFPTLMKYLLTHHRSRSDQ